ncbi:MAG: endonuclease domain-containing protein [Chloroflexota bacterium]|jgi:very-short-patch-repair endonuclease|nr:endonuclease domain-containing protein [Chloroflexota bacterium]
MSSKIIRNRARDLRKKQTPAESLLWSKLRSRQLSGFKFRRQHPIDNYILDFYCSEAHLAVEIDGSQHINSENKEMDDARTAFLMKKGIRVIRFWNNDVLNNLDDVIAEIDATLNELMKIEVEE